MSVFLSINFDSYWENRGLLLGSESDLVEFVVHPPSPMGSDRSLASELSCHSLAIEGEEHDSDDEDDIWTHHKVAGVPFFTRSYKNLDESIERLRGSGWTQLFQLAFPDADDDLVAGTWPFLDSMFHVFVLEGSPTGLAFLAVWG